MLDNYPDVLSVDQVSTILHLCRNTTYDLIHSNIIKHIKVKRRYLIPKSFLIDFLLLSQEYEQLQTNSQPERS